jgi:hypothetical protein
MLAQVSSRVGYQSNKLFPSRIGCPLSLSATQKTTSTTYLPAEQQGRRGDEQARSDGSTKEASANDKAFYHCTCVTKLIALQYTSSNESLIESDPALHRPY